MYSGLRERCVVGRWVGTYSGLRERCVVGRRDGPIR
jgi:hypothetical protein